MEMTPGSQPSTAESLDETLAAARKSGEGSSEDLPAARVFDLEVLKTAPKQAVEFGAPSTSKKNRRLKPASKKTIIAFATKLYYLSSKVHETPKQKWTWKAINPDPFLNPELFTDENLAGWCRKDCYKIRRG